MKFFIRTHTLIFFKVKQVLKEYDMGLIKALKGAAGSVVADQWKEFFYCDSISTNLLVVKGKKKTSNRSSNTKGDDNIITQGSVVSVADGQCMIIVDNGKVVEICAEPGEFTYDSSKEPSLLSGGLNGETIRAVFSNIGKRFTFGGEAPREQRIYYFNTKELIGNKYGTPSAVPVRVVDRNIGLDVDIAVRCFGEYSYRITNPILFYTNVCGNITDSYTREELDSQLKGELLHALQPAFGKLSEMGIRYSAWPAHTMELADALNEILSAKWRDLRGLEIVSFAISSIKASEEDEKMIKDLQVNASLRDPTLAAAHITRAQASAMEKAATNPNGSMMGFMGLGMAQQAGGVNAQNLYAMGQQQAQANAAAQQAQQQQAAPANSWKCSCGATATGKFCTECGKPKPAETVGWKCACGAVNKGKFCPECGAKKPEGVPQYKCDKCGWEPADPTKAPKFCPECGDPFDSGDIVK